MEVTKVESSNVDGIGYDDKEKILRISFKSGAVYDYLRVGRDVYEAFMKAPSKGQYLHKIIMKNFEYKRLA